MKNLYGEILREIVFEANTWMETEGNDKTISFAEVPNGIKTWLKNLEDQGESLNMPGKKSIIKMPQPGKILIKDTEGKEVKFNDYVNSFTKEYSQYFNIKQVGKSIDVEPVGQLFQRGESNYFTSTSHGSVTVPTGKVLVVYDWNMSSKTRASASLTIYINSKDSGTQIAKRDSSNKLSLPSERDKDSITTVGGFLTKMGGDRIPKEKEDKLTDVVNRVLDNFDIETKAYYPKHATVYDILMDGMDIKDVKDFKNFVANYLDVSTESLVNLFTTKIKDKHRNNIKAYEDNKGKAIEDDKGKAIGAAPRTLSFIDRMRREQEK